MNGSERTLHQQVAELLLDPKVYADNPRAVELRETHISLVYLTEHYVYKLKKPVKMDFLDFSASRQRKFACEEELRLNRRLAPDVYLGLTPVIQKDDNHLVLGELCEPNGATEDAVEWLVTMRRLDDADTLRAKLEANTATTQQVGCIAEVLSQFFAAQPPAKIDWREHLQRLDDHIRANRSVLLEQGGALNAAPQIGRIHTAQLTFLHSHHPLFRDRVDQGRVIDAHGDLRPDHVYVTSREGREQTVFLDCIEFSQDFRTNDCVDEVCFLAMECEHMGQHQVADQLLRQHERNQADDSPLVRHGLMPFYRSYRACVRAKVDVLRASQQDGASRQQSLDDAQTYLDIAERAICTSPLLLVVRGASGAGKSTVAAAIANKLACARLQTDQIRQELGDLVGADAASGHNQGKYSWEQRLRVYDAMFESAEQRLKRGETVILDATFLTHRLQQAALDLADRCDAKPWIVNCACPIETAQQRIAHRIGCGGASFSEAQVDTHVRQLAEQQLPPSSMPQQTVDTTAPVADVVQQILDQLPDLWSASSDVIAKSEP